MEKDLDYYLNLNWTLIEGTDLDFNGNPYNYIEIKEYGSNKGNQKKKSEQKKTHPRRE